MTYEFQLFIAVFSPSITLRLFGEVVLPGGGDFYRVSKGDGAYVLRARYVTQWENQRILEHTGMSLRTCVTCSVRRPSDVNIEPIIENLMFRTDYEVSHDFLLLENGKDIILMRRDLKGVINRSVIDRFEFDFYYGSYTAKQLPKLALLQENPHSNNLNTFE